MSKITEIVNIINSTLQGGTLASKRFQKGEFNSLAELMTKVDTDTTTIYPAIIDNNGEGTEVMLNDAYPFQIYHRITGIETIDNDGDDFGDGDTVVEQTNLKMIVFCNRRIMQFQIDDIITAINVGFPVSLSKTDLATLGSFFSQTDIEIDDIDIDKQRVWNTEFSSDNPLPPFYYVFAVNYNVQSHIMAGCFDLC